MARQETESLVRDILVKALSSRIGEPGTLRGEGKSARFDIKASLGGGSCEAEGTLDYTLPSGPTLLHKSDILLTLASGRHLAIELKCLSAVTDQFKARSYDMLHLKRTQGDEIRGIMVYVHVPGNGIGIEMARAICYPYDEFLGIETRDLADLNTWLLPVLEKLESVIARA